MWELKMHIMIVNLKWEYNLLDQHIFYQHILLYDLEVMRQH